MSRRPLGHIVALAALWLVVSCLDVASPIKGITGISTVQLPTPSVVMNDSLRDTSGNVDSLRVVAYGPNGQIVKDATVRFFAIDSTGKLRVDSMSGLAFGGDSISPHAEVVARVTSASGGVIQSPLAPLPVVPKPDSAAKSGDTTFVFDPATADTVGSGVLSPALSVTVYGGTHDTVIPSYVVSYKIVHAPPPSKIGDKTVVIYDPSGNDSTIAITNASGVATRQLRVRLKSIDPSLLSKPDSVLVAVTVKYHGQPLPVSPTDTFHIPISANLLGKSQYVFPTSSRRVYSRRPDRHP